MMHTTVDKCKRGYAGINVLTVWANGQNTGHCSATVGSELKEIWGLIQFITHRDCVFTVLIQF